MITPLKELVDKYYFKGYIVCYTKIIDYKSLGLTFETFTTDTHIHDITVEYCGCRCR